QGQAVPRKPSSVACWPSLPLPACLPHPRFCISLIPKDIPGSFCEFRFLRLIRNSVGEGLYGPPVPGPTTGAPPEPTREHHKGTPLRTQSAIGAHFVKRLIPGHIPASFPTVGCARAAKTSLGVAHTIALFAMCASLGH